MNKIKINFDEDTLDYLLLDMIIFARREITKSINKRTYEFTSAELIKRVKNYRRKNK